MFFKRVFKAYFFSISSPTSDEISRLGRLEGQVVGIVERFPRMQEELERLRAKMVELTRGFSTMKEEGLVHISDFLEVRSMIGRYEAGIASLRQARLDTLSPLHSHVDLLKVAGPQCPYLLVTAALCLIFSSFFKRGLSCMTRETP